MQGFRRMDVPADTLERVRSICLALPEAREEEAWVGTRWRVGTKTFAHVLTIHAGWPPAYARAAATEGPATVLMFRSSGEELGALRNGGAPFFAPVWRADEVGLVLGARVNWQEVDELLTDSYLVLAPKRLRSQIDRPHGS
jgi:hypothetical protein